MKHHTAAHLLNAALKQIMRVVYQRNCTVDTDSLKFQFNSFGEQLTSEQIGVIEDRINNAIQSHAAVTVETLNSLELLRQDDVTLIPGEIYPYTGIRTVEIITDDLKTKLVCKRNPVSDINELFKFHVINNMSKNAHIFLRETCCGTHVHNTSMLQYFCFLTYTSKGATKRTIKAVVGEEALQMRRAGEKIWHDIAKLEEKLQSGALTYQVLNAEINHMKEEIGEKNPQAQSVPYLIREKCLTRLESLSKAAWLREKEMEKHVTSHLLILHLMNN